MPKPKAQPEHTDLLMTIKEKAFILALRHKFRHGKVTVMVRDGFIVRIEEAYESYEMEDIINQFGLDKLNQA